MNHTPGPWHKGETVGLRNIILSPKGGMIAKILTKGDSGINANANLISAAPEMLQALEAIVNLPGPPKLSIHVLMLVNQAIKKAKGEI